MASTTDTTARVAVDTDSTPESPRGESVGTITINGKNYEVELIELNEHDQPQSPSDELARRVDAFSKDFVELYIKSAGISIQGNETILKGPGQDDIDNGNAGAASVNPEAQLEEDNESTFNGILQRRQKQNNHDYTPRTEVKIRDVWDNILGQPRPTGGAGRGGAANGQNHPRSTGGDNQERTAADPQQAGRDSTNSGDGPADNPGQTPPTNSGTRPANSHGQTRPTDEDNQGATDPANNTGTGLAGADGSQRQAGVARRSAPAEDSSRSGSTGNQQEEARRPGQRRPDTTSQPSHQPTDTQIMPHSIREEDRIDGAKAKDSKRTSRRIAYRLKKVQNNPNTGSLSPMGEVKPEAGSSNTFDPDRTTDGRGSRLLTETSERNEPAQPRRIPREDLRNALSQASSDGVGDTASDQPNIFSRFSAWPISNPNN